MRPTNILFLTCSGSERLKSEGFPECPRIVLPRSLQTYQAEREKALQPLWPLRFACTHCERAFDYPIEAIRSFAEEVSKGKIPEEEYDKLVKWSDSRRFWEVEIVTEVDIVTESEPRRRYPRTYVYIITEKDQPTAQVTQDVLRIDPPMSAYLGLEITPFDF